MSLRRVGIDGRFELLAPLGAGSSRSSARLTRSRETATGPPAPCWPRSAASSRSSGSAARGLPPGGVEPEMPRMAVRFVRPLVPQEAALHGR